MKKSKTVPKNITDETDPLDRDMTDLLRFGKWERVRYELQPKDKSITIRLSEELLSSVKTEAEKHGIDYQKFIRLTLEQAVRKAG